MITTSKTVFPVFATILNSQKLTAETKLQAIDEIRTLADRHNLTPLSSFSDGRVGFNPEAKDIDEMFLWEESSLGVNFWQDIQDRVFETNKRSC